MSRRLRAASLYLFFILVAQVCMSQEKLPNTLLWRISGKGLAKPSYLYGTMHLQDKRLFNFGDSLYQAMENVEGLALEIDFKEFFDSMMVAVFQNAEKEYLDDEEVKIDRKKLSRSADSVMKEFGISADKIGKKDLKRIRDGRLNKITQGEMQTIVDGYLYGMALRGGKWIGGIEDISDQLNLVDEIGGELTPEEVFQPEKELRATFEDMINIYVNQDLDALLDYVDLNSGTGWKDQILTHRNIKMAMRMDSLSAIRTMFFGVGAAHLPGDSGVISLLRKRGFTVEPVFSSKKIPASNYSKLKALQWHKVQDNEKLFSIEMPGAPSEYNMMGQAFQMKMFFDLTTMTFYMAGRTIGRLNNTTDSDKMIAAMAEKMGVEKKQVKKKEISRQDLFGVECSIDAPAAYFTVQLIQKKKTLFLLMAGSNKKTNLVPDDVSHFFSSFTPNEIAENNNNWKKFSFPGRYAYVMIPGEPKPNSAINERAKGSAWEFDTYDHLDHQKGLYYLLQVRDIKQGYYLNGDSSYFSIYETDLSKTFNKVIRSERGLYKGFPSFYFEGIAEAENILYKTFHVIRGNRIHSLIVGGDPKSDFSDAETFFNSLSFENYPLPEIKTYYSDGFSTTTIAPIKKIEKANDEESSERLHYLSHSPAEVISYEIFKEPLGPLYWKRSDSLFFAEQEDAATSEGDSVLKKEMKYNGKLRSIDLLVQRPQSNNLKKIRLFVNGDTLYTLISYIPSQYINEAYHLKFFEDFRVTKETQPTIYSDKSAQLLNALKTKDSLEFENASSILNKVSFDKSSLPYLHRALFEIYRDEGEGYGVYEKIIDDVKNLADSTTVPFIRMHFKELTGEKEVLKYSLLRMLAQFKTAESYAALKELLMTQLPTKGNEGSLAWALRDSMKLTRTLYPEILALHKDSAFRELLVSTTNFLLDSNMIDLKDVLPYREVFMAQAKNALKIIADSADLAWQYNDWIYLTGKFNDKQSNALLQQFLLLEPINIKYSAIIALARNKQPIDPKQIEKTASDKSFRLSLYDDLVRMNRKELFPVKYANQKSLAEAELFEIASDDMEVSQISFIGERTVDFMGKKKKFFLFKITTNGEEDQESYLGIAGPYSLDSKQLISYADATELYWKETYDKSKLDVYFREFLKSTEEYMKERDADSVK